MPGYDISRFINLKDEDELMCGICHGIFIDPKVTPCCRQTYCGECIEHWLQENNSCPNDRQQLFVDNLSPAPRIVSNMLNKLIISCEYSEIGCEENFLLENINLHMNTCLYNPNNICESCNHIRGDISEHNCIENLNAYINNISKSITDYSNQFQLSQIKLNLTNEKCENLLQEINCLKEEKSKLELQVIEITKENKYLKTIKNDLLNKLEKLKELNSELEPVNLIKRNNVLFPNDDSIVDIIDLNMENLKLQKVNDDLLGISSKLYQKLLSIESDKLRLQNNHASISTDIKIFIKSMDKYFSKQKIESTQINRLDCKAIFSKPSNDFKAALKVLNDNTNIPENENKLELFRSLSIIEKEWLKVADDKHSNIDVIKDYIDCIKTYSMHLLSCVVNLDDLNGNTAIHYAISYNNYEKVSVLLNTKVCDLNKANKDGYTATMLAALSNALNKTQIKVITRLLELGDVNAKVKQNGKTSLMLAASNGQFVSCKILLECGASVNVQDNDGLTALMWAAKHGHKNVVQLLRSHPDCNPK